MMKMLLNTEIDAIPKDWTADYFKNLVEYNLGRTPSRSIKKYWDEGTYDWVSISDMVEFETVKSTKEKVSELAHNGLFKKGIVPKGTLLMSFKLTIGRTAFLGIDAYHNEAIISIYPNEQKVLKTYLFYYLPQIEFNKYFDRAVKGNTLNKSKIDSLEILLPPLPEQRKITYVLSAVQKAVEKQDRLIKTTTELKKALMQKLFTEGLHGEPQKETEIGLVPESWEVDTIGHRCKLNSGGTPSRKEKCFWTNGNILWVKTGEINYDTIYDTEEKITVEGLANSSAKLFPKGTLLIAMYGQGITRGRVGILGCEASTNQACAAIFPNIKKKLKEKYLYYFLEYSYDKIRDFGHGANQKNLSSAIIKTFEFPIPSPGEQLEIVKGLKTVDSKIKLYNQKRQTVTALFKTLLHELMTGQRRVREIDFEKQKEELLMAAEPKIEYNK